MSFDYTNRAWIRESRTSIKNTSYDKDNNEFMTESSLNVISFDSVKEKYLSIHDLDKSWSNSADALASDGIQTYLIEFKNGAQIDNHQIENKLKDSVIILCDEWHRTISDTRKEIVFVLVYNEDQKKLPANDLRAISIANKSGGTQFRFGLNKAKMYVKKALIYNKSDFEKKLLHKLKSI